MYVYAFSTTGLARVGAAHFARSRSLSRSRNWGRQNRKPGPERRKTELALTNNDQHISPSVVWCD